MTSSTFDLCPDGTLALDALADHARSPEAFDSGAEFWRPEPHLVLTETIPYPDVGASLDQHHVVDESGETTTYRFRERHYDRAELTVVLDEHGFTVDRVRADLRGTTHTEQSESLGVVARRR